WVWPDRLRAVSRMQSRRVSFEVAGLRFERQPGPVAELLRGAGHQVWTSPLRRGLGRLALLLHSCPTERGSMAQGSMSAARSPYRLRAVRRMQSRLAIFAAAGLRTERQLWLVAAVLRG